MEFKYLADCEESIPTIAKWYVDQWGPLAEGETFEDALRRMRGYLHRDRIPFVLVGLDRDGIRAVAQLKYYEMGEMYPDREHWLGGVYVPAEHRGNGVGGEIVEKIVSIAPEHGVETLHLQTEKLDGGLYARLGWTPVEQVVNRLDIRVLVMERHLGTARGGAHGN